MKKPKPIKAGVNISGPRTLRPIIIHTTIFQIIGRNVRFGRNVRTPISVHLDLKRYANENHSK